MIWGRTYTQYKEQKLAWKIWFAWRPIQFEDGRWCWLQKVRRRREEDQYDGGYFSIYKELK